MRFAWDERKSEVNLRERGFDFAFASLIFDGATVEVEDRRRDYGEKRMVAIGQADGIPLTVIYPIAVTTASSPGESSRHEGAIAVSARSTRKQRRAEPVRPSRGRADIERLRTMSDAEVDSASPPALKDLPPDFWNDAVVVPPPKRAISLRVDQDVLDWFRSRGPRYQSRMNAVLRAYMSRMQDT